MQKSCGNKAEVLQGSDTKPKVFSAPNKEVQCAKVRVCGLELQTKVIRRYAKISQSREIGMPMQRS